MVKLPNEVSQCSWYVYCTAGVNRSFDTELREGDLVVMYLRPPPEVFGSSTVPVKRPEILPVFGYVQHAQKYGNRNNEQLHPRVGWYCV